MVFCSVQGKTNSIGVEMAACTKCGVDQPITAYWKQRGKRRATCIACELAANRLWRQKNPARAADLSRRKFWKQAGIKITTKEYYELKQRQAGRCAICGTPEDQSTRKLAVDHDHVTGKIRGLLCMVCNSRVVQVIEQYGHLIPKVREYLGGQNVTTI